MADPHIEALTERLARLEAERAITATLYRYGNALDYGDLGAFLECFAPDARYEVRMRLGAENDFTCTGHDELRSYFESHTHAPDAYHKHVTVNPVVDVDGQSASAVSYFMRVDAVTQGPAVVLASGRYVDGLEQHSDGAWRITTRRCEVENL